MTERYEVYGIAFEWDGKKAETNASTHGVRFEEAALAFFDLYGLTMPDLFHSKDENRLLLLAQSGQRMLLVVHVERGPAIRIISARLAEPRERRQYERHSNAR